MQAELKLSLDRWRWEFDVPGAVIVSSTLQAHSGASIDAYHLDPLTGQFVSWMTMAANLNKLGASVTRVFSLASSFLGWFPADHVVASTGTISNYVDVLDYQVYTQVNGVTGKPEFVASWSGLEWWVNGALVDSVGAGSSAGFTLNITSLPLIGGFLRFGGGAEVVPLPPDTGSDCPALSTTPEERSALSIALGGYRYQEGGVWVTPAIDMRPDPHMPTAGACSVDYEPTCTGTVSNAVTVSARARADVVADYVGKIDCACPDGQVGDPKADVWDCESINETASAGVFIVPNWPRSWLKLVNNPGDFRVMAGRDNLPQVLRHRTAQCTLDGVGATFADIEEVLPDGSTFRDVVGSSAEPIEDLAALSVPCMHERRYAHAKAYGRLVVFDPLSGLCESESGPEPPGDPICDGEEKHCSVVQSYEGIDWVANVTEPPILDYPDGPTDIGRFKRYVDTWVGFWWVFSLSFDEWEVLSTPTPYPVYWPFLGDQHLTHPALPLIKDRKTRTSVQSDALMVAPLLMAVWWRLYYGHPRLGVGNLKVDSATLPSSKALTSASSPAWTFDDCTCAFGADMQLTPIGGATTIKATYDVGRWGEAPFQYPKFSQKVRPDWVSTNIDAVRVYIVGEDGSEKLLEFVSGDGFTAANKDYDIYADLGTKYAGTWQWDYGVGLVLDVGTDLDGDGISLATLTDPERAASFNLLSGAEVKEIRVEVDVVNPANPVNLKYLLFKAPTTDKRVYWEARQFADIVYSAGPGVRWGTQDYAPLGTLVSPPSVRPHASPSTVVDWLAWKRAYILGTDPTSGVSAELATLFDVTEGNTVEEASLNTLAFLMPFRLGNVFYCGIVSGYDTPPLPQAPLKALSTRDWTRSGARTLQIVQLAVEPRYGVTDGSNPMHWYDSSDVQWTTSVPTTMVRWSVTKHLHAVDNNEDYGKWKKGTKELGTQRPWHGAFAVWKGAEKANGGGIWNFVDPLGRYHELWIQDDDVYHGWSDSGVPWTGLDGQAQVTTSADCSWPRGLCTTLDGDLLIVYTRETSPGVFDSYFVTARNSGGSYEPETLLLSGVAQTVPAKNVMGGVLTAGRRTSDGKIVGCYQGPADTSPGADFVFVDQLGADIVIEDLGLCFVEPHDPLVAYVLVAVKSGGSSQTRWVCKQTTGDSWEEL